MIFSIKIQYIIESLTKHCPEKPQKKTIGFYSLHWKLPGTAHLTVKQYFSCDWPDRTMHHLTALLINTDKFYWCHCSVEEQTLRDSDNLNTYSRVLLFRVAGNCVRFRIDMSQRLL